MPVLLLAAAPVLAASPGGGDGTGADEGLGDSGEVHNGSTLMGLSPRIL